MTKSNPWLLPGMVGVATLLMLAIPVLTAVEWHFTAWALVALLLSVLTLQSINARTFRRWARRPSTNPIKLSQEWHITAGHLFNTIHSARTTRRGYIQAFKRVRNSANNLPDACVIVARDGNIVDLNTAAENLLSLSRADVGAHFAALIRQPSLTEAIQNRDFSNVFEFPSPVDRKVQLDVRLIDLDGEQSLIIARDVTELNRLLSMRQDFIANITHELRTPLTVLVGYIESITEDDLDAETVKELAERLVSPTHRMRALVEDLLVLTRLESSPYPRVDDIEYAKCQDLLHPILFEARQLSSPAHEITTSIDPNLAIECVTEELQSAVTNLITNAIRYSPDGGKIDIRWQRVGEVARFEVVDQGIGIPNEHIARITERFYRVDKKISRAHGGTGLGLAIVKHILQRHRSTLAVESEQGRGSRFYFDLRLARTKVESVEIAAAA